MLNKKDLKDIQSLGHKKFRDEARLFIAEGPKIVCELIDLVPGQIEKIYATGEWLQENKTSVEAIEVSEEELERISHLRTPNKVLAVIRHFNSHEPGGSSFSLYLDTIQDPGNFGTIIRIADWFAIKNVICSKGSADLYNPKVIQSTMASIARVNVWYDSNESWLANQKATVYAATLNGKSIYDYEGVDRGILIIGNESKGIHSELLQRATEKITIPGKGGAESLNAAVATGIILSHLLIS